MIISRRKGILALQELVIIIISLIGLFMLLQVIFGWFFNVPTNLQIADQNAISIKEFVDFSSKKFSNEDCYVMLKLTNLENFQYRRDTKGADEKYYIYYINNKGVKIYGSEFFNNLIKGKNLPKMEKNVDFENIQTLKKDNTKQGSDFSVDYYFLSIGTGSSKLDLKNSANFFVLVPSIDKKLFNLPFTDISLKVPNIPLLNDLIENNQNTLFSFVSSIDEVVKEDGNYLVFNPGKKELFLSASDQSNLLIRKNLCSVDGFVKQKYNSNILLNPELTDYLNYELVFDAFVSGVPKNDKLVWNVNGIKCPNNSLECTSKLGESYSTFSYDEFKDAIIKYYNKYPNYELKIVKVRKLSSQEKVLLGSKLKKKRYDFNFLFYNLFKENEFDSTKNNDKEYIIQNLEKKDSNGVYKGFKETLSKNGCVRVACEYGLLYQNIVFYYDFELRRYVSFRHDLLRRDIKTNKLYFQGEEISYHDVFLREEGWTHLLQAKRRFIVLEINIKTKGKRSVIISPYQFESIDLLEEEKK